MQFTFGFAPPLMIETAIRHGVFDALYKGAKTLDSLCAETGTSPRGLRMVLNALVGLDVLSKGSDGHYALTEESATFLVRRHVTETQQRSRRDRHRYRQELVPHRRLEHSPEELRPNPARSPGAQSPNGFRRRF
jgi:hypothetical protein